MSIAISMKDKYYQVILEKDHDKESDFSGLFQAILSVGDEMGLERALGYLERCVVEKRLAWLDERLEKMERMGKLLTKQIRKW